MSDGGLIYAPATPGAETYLIALAGPTGSGKTLSALRLARGLAGPDGKIFFCDTENRRGLRYARDFEFMHASMSPPFISEKYTVAAEQAQKAGAAVLILDSVSHEHVGPGGMLERFEDELTRLAGDNYERRDRLKGTAWIKPKRAHKAMLQRFIQLNMHVICCLRAEPKLVIRPDPKKPGKTEWADAGLQPVCGSDFMFDMTMSLMLYPLDPKNPSVDPRGIPVPIKLDKQDAHLVPLDRVLDESVGAAIGAKARGETVAPKSQRHEMRTDVPTDPNAGSDLIPSGQSSVESKPPPLRGEAKNRAKADELIARFNATRAQVDHQALIALDEVQDALRWFLEKRPEMAKEINAALNESWKRCNPFGSGTPSNETAKSDTPPDKDQQRADQILADIAAAEDEEQLKAATGGTALQTLAKRWLQERPELAKAINDAEKAKADQLRSVTA
jgi:DNA polymerase III delta prime subunit